MAPAVPPAPPASPAPSASPVAAALSAPSLQMVAVARASALDARRGVVRLHAQALDALGARPWDPLLLRGNRETAALAALSAPTGDARSVECDSLTLANLQVADGGGIAVRRAAEVAAARVLLAGPDAVTAVISPEAVRMALLGKVVCRGDQVSLLPQDFTTVAGVDEQERMAVVRALTAQLGEHWSSVLLVVAEALPDSAAIVTMSTVVGFAGGRTTTSSATPLTALTAPAGSTVLPPPGVGAPPVPSHPLPTQAPPPFAATRQTWPAQGTGGLPQAVAPVTAAPVTAAPPAPVTDELPGLEDAIATLMESLDLGFHHLDLLANLGGAPQLGVLIAGPAGSGKAALAQLAAARSRANVLTLWGPTLAGLDVNDAARQLRDTFTNAAARRPVVILVEDVEALAPADNGGALLGVAVTAFRQALGAGGIAVVATTSKPDEVSEELLRPGLLERRIDIALPDRDTRRRILAALTQAMPLAGDVDLGAVAAHTPGFVAADLLALCREAALQAAQRQRDLAPGAVPTVTAADFAAALTGVRPTALGGQALELPDLSLDDVGDMADVKQALTEAVIWPLTYPDTFGRLGVTPPHGVLLYGPPGCGKTYLVRALAGSGRANFLSVKGAELLSKWVGESERGVRELFRRARSAAPAVIFLDEIDALAPPRRGTDDGVSDRVVAALLTELDGIEVLRDVVVIGATNRPDLVDPALLRPGRLDRAVHVPAPDADARARIIQAAARQIPLAPDVDLSALAAQCDGYSAADCVALLREAAIAAMRESLDSTVVTRDHLEQARGRVQPSIRPEMAAMTAAFAAR
jgi:SpoVK/Ycf46/Vps4 family AAA+-type ATPase